MTELALRVDEIMPQAIADLKELISIPSISSIPAHAPDVLKAQTTIADWLRELGAARVQIVQEGGQPAVIANFPAPVGQPTVCLYAHADVQPVGDAKAWTAPPFTAIERQGRLWGRGTADDKCGVAAHLAVLRAFEGKPPVGVTLFIEGEEESGSPSLRKIIARHSDALEADVFVIADSGNWEVGWPAITNTLRGLGECEVTVRTLDHGVHSGEFGGVVPDALTTLCRLLATLHDDEGNVAVAGLLRTPASELEYPLDRLAREAGKLPGVEWIGSGPIVQRLWNAPAISVLALDATPVAEASNTLIPEARAKIGMRIAPGDDGERALYALIAHLEANISWGAELEITDANYGQPGIITAEGPAFTAMMTAMQEVWGRTPELIGTGGSIPMIAEFMEVFPEAEVLCVGPGDPDSRIHGLDESLELADFSKYVLAEAKLLAALVKPLPYSLTG